MKPFQTIRGSTSTKDRCKLLLPLN